MKFWIITVFLVWLAFASAVFAMVDGSVGSV